MFSTRCVKLLAGVLCSSMVISIAPISRLFDKVNADTIINYAGENPSPECSCRSVEEASFTAEVKTINKWSGHSNIEITFKNTGTETIHDWYFTFDFNYKIENPYNCRVIENKDNLYTIGNNDWNQDIQPGKTVTIGFTAASKDGSDIKDMPTFYLLNTETVTLKSGDLTYKYEEYSNWSSGFNGALILTNKTKETIKDWTITFSANRPITQADSSVFTDNSDGTYTITNDGNNQNIAKGQSYRIGIQGGANNPSKAFELADFTATAKKMALKLTDDKDKNGTADVLEIDFNGAITVTPTVTSTPTNTVTSTPTVTNTPSAAATTTATNTPTVSPSATSKPTATVTSTPKPTATATNTSTATPSVTTKPTTTNTPTSTNKPTSTPTATSKPTVTSTIMVSNTPTAKPTATATPTVTVTPKPTPTATATPFISVTPTCTVTNTPMPTATNSPTPTLSNFDLLSDKDNDGLKYYEELSYGTDPNKADTDDDGVSDNKEIKMFYNPLVKDTNDNGKLDGEEDFDEDGIINRLEESNGTCPYAKDTDYDGLNDYDELFVYHTDPNNDDTDGDYIVDGDEIILGTDPKAQKTNSVIDNENTREYSLSSSNDKLSEFNTNNLPYKLSVDIKAAGVVNKYINISETGYKNALCSNPYILGKIPCISYVENMRVESVTVRFSMQAGFDENISDYTVFYFWEGYNLLIPIKTYYDEYTKTVFANNIFMGTYCLIDTNQLRAELEVITDDSPDKTHKEDIYDFTLKSPINYEVTIGPKYYLNNNEYFLIYSDTPMNYNDAIDICAQYNGHPATIADAAENNTVERAANLNEVWLGASIEKTGFLKYKINWVDGGQDNGYECWGNNVPIVALNGGEGIYSWMGLWFLIDPSSSLNAVVCERTRGSDNRKYSGINFMPDDEELNKNSDSDRDGDGIPDYLELSEYDLGIFDDEGLYTPSSYSNYIEIAKESGMPIDEGIKELIDDIKVPSYESDPYSADKDGDGYLDFEDGTPYEANKDMIVVLYLKEDGDVVNEARELQAYYSSLNKKVFILGFYNYSTFMTYWSSIGSTYNKYGVWSPSEKYYYNVTDVILISHGDAYGVVEGVLIELGNSEYLVSDIKETIPSSRFHPIMNIDACRRFKSLDMMVCYSAYQGGRHYLNKSLADTFISHFSTIYEVYCFDGKSTFIHESGKLIWAGSVNIDDYTSINDCPFKGQALYYRTKVGEQRRFINDLYSGNQDIYFRDSSFATVRPVLNASKNNYYDPVMR